MRLPRTTALASLFVPAIAALGIACAAERPGPPPVVRSSLGEAAAARVKVPPPEPAPASEPAPACAPLRVDPPPLTDVPGLPDVAVPPLVDPSGQAMKGFYDKLARLLRGKAKDHLRIAVYGDSNGTRDFITGGMRRTLQRRYGDAGHGFVALGRPWSHYRHMDVRHGPVYGFASYACTTHPVGDRGYGISGIAAESLQTGAAALVATVEGAPIGRRAGRVGVFYLKKPGHGRFSVRIDGVEAAMIDTAAPETSVEYRTFDVPEGPHEALFVATSARRVRLLGAVLEGATPGIVVDSLGVGAMNTKSQWREDPDVNRAMLRRRPYDLIVFTTGTNDFRQMDEVPRWLGEVIERHREALPGVSVLITSPPDRGQVSSETNIAVGKQRREIAEKRGAAFWDLWAAMGGRGSMARFHGLGLGIRWDHVHLSESGGAFLGERLVRALLDDFAAHLQRHPEAGCGD